MDLDLLRLTAGFQPSHRVWALGKQQRRKSVPPPIPAGTTALTFSELLLTRNVQIVAAYLEVLNMSGGGCGEVCADDQYVLIDIPLQ